MSPATTVTFLYFEGCPNCPAMMLHLRQAISRLGVGLVVEEVNLESLPEEDVRRGFGAPTILVNGADLFGNPLPIPGSSPSCRLYAGGVLPDADAITDALNGEPAGPAP